MAHKDFYDEDEIIDSIVDETNQTEAFKRQQKNRHFQPPPRMHVQQVGCGCFDSRKFMINFGIYSLVLMATAGLFPGFYIDGVFAAIRAAFTLTLLNTFVKPFIVFVTFPITLLTVGLFYFAINGMILMMTAGLMGGAFVISNFFTAVFAALFISILQHFIKKHLLNVDQL